MSLYPFCQIKTADFDIAKPPESASHALTGTVDMTRAYMFCGQASCVKSGEVDARSDN
jgi:hypothetical protein